MGAPDGIASTNLSLAADEAYFLMGAALVANGGLTAHTLLTSANRCVLPLHGHEAQLSQPSGELPGRTF